jgi:cell division protein FtsB
VFPPEIAGFFATLTGIGPIGAIIASVLIALVLVVIIAAWAMGLLDSHRTDSQKTDFQGKLLEAIKALTDRETELVRENASLRDDMGRLQATVDLMREQNRRVIELLRSVMEGRIAPGAIQIPDLGAPR